MIKDKYSMNDFIEQINHSAKSLQELSTETRKILIRRIDHDKMKEELKKINININQLKKEHFLLSILTHDIIDNLFYTNQFSEQDYFNFTKCICFNPDLIINEKRTLLNSMIRSHGSPSFWLNIFASFDEKEQNEIIPFIGCTDIIFFHNDIKPFYDDKTINVLKNMIEHHSGVEFLRYRRILKLGIESPDDALFSILDKNIFHYIYNSNNSPTANALIYHLTNNFIGALENNQNEEKNRIEKLVSIESMYKIIDCIDNNLQHFQNTQPVVIIARNFFLKELTARGIRDNEYHERKSYVDVGCDYANIDNINCLTMYIKRKNSNILPPEFYTSIEQEILNHTIKSSPDNIQHKKVRL